MRRSVKDLKIIGAGVLTNRNLTWVEWGFNALCCKVFRYNAESIVFIIVYFSLLTYWWPMWASVDLQPSMDCRGFISFQVLFCLLVNVFALSCACVFSVHRVLNLIAFQLIQWNTFRLRLVNSLQFTNHNNHLQIEVSQVLSGLTSFVSSKAICSH